MELHVAPHPASKCFLCACQLYYLSVQRTVAFFQGREPAIAPSNTAMASVAAASSLASAVQPRRCPQNALRHAPSPVAQSARPTRPARRSALRVQATQAPAAPAAGSTSASADESGVLDVVVVGAGISGLTAAQVRWRPRCCRRRRRQVPLRALARRPAAMPNKQLFSRGQLLQHCVTATPQRLPDRPHIGEQQPQLPASARLPDGDG